MGDRAEITKLAELRSKTDRQLLALIGNRLDAAFASAQSAGGATRAEQLYAEVRVLLALTESALPSELRRIERRLQQLATLLEGRIRAACA